MTEKRERTPSDADTVFAAFVAQARTKDAMDIETVCRAHPALADELRRLHADWVFTGLAADESFAGGSQRDWSEFVARLRRRHDDEPRYESRGEVARGGMGVVLRVFDKDLLRPLAMKVVRDDTAQGSANKKIGESRSIVARFLEEAQVTSQLDHPGIVPVHDVGVDPYGRVFYTMKLVRGVELRAVFEKMRTGDPEWRLPRVLSVLQRVCEAMSYAHDKGVIHRDLKPANVMIGRYGETYVMDWGLARVSARTKPAPSERQSEETGVVRTLRDRAKDPTGSPLATIEGEAMGTPCYMAPEQASGRLDDLGPWTDVYALGAMLYEALSGTRPYLDEMVGSSHEVVARVRSGPPTKLAELAPEAPAELVAICEKAMARSIEARYPSMRRLADDLRNYLEGRVVEAHATGPLVELKKWVLRNRGISASIGAALLVIAALVVLFVMRLDRERDVAIAEKENVLRLADMKKLEELRAEADELWPADEAHVPALLAWIDRADDLLGRREQHERTLAELRASGSADASGRVTFDDDERQWWHDTLAGFVAELGAFAGDGARGTTRGALARRLEFARTLRARSIDEHRMDWQRTILEISDPERCPAYGGLVIAPQLGLVPLGRDRASGLHEFAHLASGAPALRDADGKLAIGDETGVVLVLLPGGTFAEGAQSSNAGVPNFDAQALPDESPPTAVTLAPFFISKFEMTQAQWARIAGANPSFYPAGSRTMDGETLGWTNPVEQITWTDARTQLARLALRLPTEAQWEFAARAGTSTPWWTGATRETLAGAINIADEAARRMNADWETIADWVGFDDGFPVHAPVDALRPNPFGLHHACGNVAEWCEDCTLMYSSARRPGDGLLLGDELDFKVTRGGTLAGSASDARSSARAPFHKDVSRSYLGVRPARQVDVDAAESR